MTEEQEINDMLLGMLGTPELVKQWWNSANRHFDGMTPRQKFNEEPDAVHAYVSLCCHGGW